MAENNIGMLLGTLRDQLGARDGGDESHDIRVWIVEIKGSQSNR